MAEQKQRPPILFITNQQQEDTKLIRLVRENTFDVSFVEKYRAVFIDQKCNFITIIKQIRKNDKTAIYLKPVFLKKSSAAALSRYAQQVVDGVCDDDDIAKYYLFSKVLIDKANNRILECLKKTRKTMPNEFDLFLKVIRYLYTRGTTINPIRYAKSIYGYIYPAVNVFFTNPSHQEFRLVDFLEKKNLIEGTFIDTIHTCNYCYSSFLNFREICTNCGSVKISDEDLVHHFSCGYVGPEKDYISASRFVCPKCRKELKHIGVDFDRPSTVFSCLECGHNFQEPDVDCLCLNCGKKSTPANLDQNVIKKFRLTPLGENSALNGIVYSLKDELGEKLEIIEQKAFRVILTLEIERISRYAKSNSTVTMLSMTNFLDLAARMGNKTIDLTREIGKEIRAVLRATDVLSFYNDTILLMLFTETNLEGSEIAMSRLKKNISKLIKDNLESEITLDYKMIELKKSHDYQQIIRELTKNV